MKRITFYILLFFVSLLSCKKFVTVDLPNSRMSSEAVFKSDVTAMAAALGMYQKIGAFSSFGGSGSDFSVTFLCGIAADELYNYYISYEDIANNDMTPVTSPVASLWSSAYGTIYVANAVLEGIAQSTSLSADTKKQLEGEACFVRAFTNFYLVNLFGDIPIITTTDYRVNAIAPRTPTATVYEHIIKDLENARTLLGEEYVTEHRARPNKWAATALLARVYLYFGEWAKAEAMATSIIDNTAQFNLVADLDGVFLAESKEAIWTLAADADYYNTYDGYNWILTFDPWMASINDDLATGSFEPGDNRRDKWIGTYDNGSKLFYYPYKYKVQYNSGPEHSENPVVMRLAEQYLIRAEARAKQNKLTGANSAESDINAIRNRAGLGNTTATTQPQLLLAVEQERKVELFTEWGHRWFDLVRTGRADAVLGAVKPAWQPTDKLFPLPEVEMNNAPNLKPQNPGY